MGDSGVFDFGVPDDYSSVARGAFPSNFTLPSYTPPAGDTSSFGDIARNVGGGIKSVASGFGDVAKAALPFASLGATGVGIASSIQARNQAAEQNRIMGRAEKLQERTAGEAASAAAPLTQFGSDALAKAQRGEIPAPMQALIDQWKQGAKAQMHQYLASIGQGDSQTLAQMDAEIDKQGVAMAAQMLQQEISQGAGALTGAAGALTGAGQVAGQVGQRAAGQTGDLERLIFEANRQLAAVTGAAG